MATISNDKALRDLLEQLSVEQQRLLGLRFAQSLIHLSRDERVKRAIEIGLRPDASESELEDAYRGAKAWSTKTYTDCGKDTDWLAQGDHFVAAAVAAALTPDSMLPDNKTNRAWKAAMHARMANNCELVEGEGNAHLDEVKRQYEIAGEFASAD
ncbi:hypothetical protein U5801_13385 [Lamprobacter modestohalophilus]|uniref:Uncharacterized protein n=1 Tax=Lamprobacter modestohalophilus TaxID=1064514 RepID=A0A9X0W5H7_9GAMM|nr:hypothetical protein [Lamprobacter modestohalophilus]MBK1617156.1 hypothetical protein [Lamprobacter modestohalophilus]MEA1050792.1 hypothetical protein [Lamprobacter modestohalophilus]